jgi:hypothetical protein
MTTPRLQTYAEFWPFYLGEHSLPATRWWHFAGTSLAALNLSAALLLRRPSLVLSALFVGYLFAWVSHFFVEKNRPATFTYPLWSFVSDWRMWALMALGKLPAELERFGITPRARAASPG